MPVPTVEWIGGADGTLRIIDQTLLPGEYRLLDLGTLDAVWEAIRTLRVRGAPAIGVATAFGVYVGVRDWSGPGPAALLQEVERVCQYLGTARPTAVNLFWALDRMRECARRNATCSTNEIKQAMLAEARQVLAQDKAVCRKLGENGAGLIRDGSRVLTHCNAGALATADYGTALAVLFRAHEEGKRIQVFADETRPLLQGARLTTWELMQEGIDVTLICDNVAAQVMVGGRVDMVLTGADRIAANGDTANKIGTYGLAVLARYHSIPFYVVAPASTFDLSLATGKDIPIEERPAWEVTDGFGKRTAPEGVRVYNPAFDVTPHELITAIVTELGIIAHPDAEGVSAVLSKAGGPRRAAR